MDNDKAETNNGKATSPATSALAEVGAFGDIRSVRMSFDPTTPEGAAKLVQAQLSELPSLEEMRGKPFLLTDFMYHPASTPGETEGEVKEFRRIVVWDSTGQAYDCGSQGIDKSLAVIESTAGPGPWKPPIKCTLEIRKTSLKRNLFFLVPDIQELQKRLTVKK